MTSADIALFPLLTIADTVLTSSALGFPYFTDIATLEVVDSQKTLNEGNKPNNIYNVGADVLRSPDGHRGVSKDRPD